jgi:ADP-L-glycero-D-manno-heptose 6-epimerase
MYVVTGGAGFIGSNIVAALEARGVKDIVVVDRLRSGDKWRNIGKRGLADIVHPDYVLQYLETNVKSVEAVIHMGAISSTTEIDADKILTNNFSLTLGLWKWCSAHEKRFIYASSAATYGDGSRGFSDEFSEAALARLRPMNPYGWSKHLFDRRVASKVFDNRRTPAQWVGLKFFNVYGPNEYHKGGQQSVVAQVYPRAAADANCLLFKSHNPQYPDGGQMRDFVWVGDCVDVVMWAAGQSAGQRPVQPGHRTGAILPRPRLGGVPGARQGTEDQIHRHPDRDPRPLSVLHPGRHAGAAQGRIREGLHLPGKRHSSVRGELPAHRRPLRLSPRCPLP